MTNLNDTRRRWYRLSAFLRIPWFGSESPEKDEEPEAGTAIETTTIAGTATLLSYELSNANLRLEVQLDKIETIEILEHEGLFVYRQGLTLYFTTSVSHLERWKIVPLDAKGEEIPGVTPLTFEDLCLYADGGLCAIDLPEAWNKLAFDRVAVDIFETGIPAPAVVAKGWVVLGNIDPSIINPGDPTDPLDPNTQQQG